MPTLKEIKNRIQGVKNTQKITRAMKIVATTRLKKLERMVTGGQDYEMTLKRIYEELSKSCYDFDHELISENGAEKKVGVIVISSDRGLCGAFNSQLFRSIDDYIRTELGAPAVELFLLGNKAASNYKKTRDTVVYSAVKFSSDERKNIATEVIEKAVEKFRKKELSDIYLIFNGYRARADYGFTVSHLLPFKNMEVKMDLKTPRKASRFIVEPSLEECLDVLIPLCLRSEMISALVQSQTAEELSRMLAMDYATENANELLGGLTLVYNRTRQSVITKELAEIVGGAEALK